MYAWSFGIATPIRPPNKKYHDMKCPCGQERTAPREEYHIPDTEQSGIRRSARWEIGSSTWVIRSRYAEWTQSPEGHRVVKKALGNQGSTEQRGGCRSGGRVLNREKGAGWSGRHPISSRGHQGDPISRFGFPQETSSIPRRIWCCAQIFSVMRSYFHSSFCQPDIA